LISNSDCHSPEKIAREANVFETELSYTGIMDAIRSKDPKKFLYTIEFFPEEGRYHFDGHRKCGIVFSPSKTKKHGGICPVCGKGVTIGVSYRVNELADRKEGFYPKGAIPYKSLIPLKEIISEVIGVGVTSKAVGKEYENLINTFGNELEILLNISEKDLKNVVKDELAKAIILVRKRDIYIEPGYDGLYGKVSIFKSSEKKQRNNQKILFQNSRN